MVKKGEGLRLNVVKKGEGLRLSTVKKGEGLRLSVVVTLVTYVFNKEFIYD